MIIVSGSSHPNLAIAIATKLSLPIYIANVKKFADQEMKIQLEGNFLNQDIVIIQSTAKPANDHLMELLLLADIVKHAGARKIIAAISYFGYARQSQKVQPDEPLAVRLIAKLMESSGIDNIITLDLHSKELEKFFKININNIDLSSVFLPLISKSNNNIIISPDEGGIERAKKLAILLSADFAFMNKVRNKNGECIMSGLKEDVMGKNCILIDDIIESGETICLAAKLLNEKGAKSIEAYITHAVLSRGCIEKIENSTIKRIYVSDSINQQNLSNKIKVISVANVFISEISKFLAL
jgi:ribose-phosphate pyrophosphokinase